MIEPEPMAHICCGFSARLAPTVRPAFQAPKAADFTPDGHATTVRLNADAIRSHLTFDRTRKSETITIAGHSLDTYLGFAPGTQISYDVDAAAAMVGSSLPNAPGAKPSVTLKGGYVRATIR